MILLLIDFLDIYKYMFCIFSFTSRNQGFFMHEAFFFFLLCNCFVTKTLQRKVNFAGFTGGESEKHI